LPDEWQQAVGASRRQAASQATEIKAQAKAGALVEEPSQKKSHQRKLERTKAGRARGRDRRREPESQPLVIRRCNGRRMADTHRRLSRRCKVRLKSKVHHKPVRGIGWRKLRDSNRKPKQPACDEIPGRTTVEPGSWSPAQAGRPTKTQLKDSGNGSRRQQATGASRRCGGHRGPGTGRQLCRRIRTSGVSQMLNCRRSHSM